MSKLVTVGIPFYNNEHTLANSINATVKQTYKNLEIILIDDGSTDGSLEIAQIFAKADNRISIINDGTNKGLISRLNQIILLSRGEYVARMDADDLMDLERIEKQVNYMEEYTEVDVLTTGMVSMSNNFELLGKRCCHSTRPDIYNVFKNGDGLLHASMMTRNTWSKSNLYLEGFDRAEDRELFTRTLATSSYHILPDLLYYYTDVQNITLEKYLKSYQSERKALKRNWKGVISFFQLSQLLLRSYLKTIVIRMYFLSSNEQKLLINKNTPMTSNEILVIKNKIQEIRA